MKLAFLLKIFSSISAQIVKDKDVFYSQKAMKRDFSCLCCISISFAALCHILHIYPKPPGRRSYIGSLKLIVACHFQLIVPLNKCPNGDSRLLAIVYLISRSASSTEQNVTVVIFCDNAVVILTIEKK
jgi:hypothetical protein